VPVFREEELCDGRVRRLVERVQSHHLQAGAIDKERHALEIANPDEVRAVFENLEQSLRSASAYFRADTSRTILEAATTAPVSATIGESVYDTRIAVPSARARSVSK
jgi:hypothetical protein